MKVESIERFSFQKIKLLIIFVIAFLGLTYVHNVVKMVAVEKNFSDFANYYFFSHLLQTGKNIYNIPAHELARLKEKSGLPVHIAGKPEYAPLFFLVFSPLTLFTFGTANLLWLVINHIVLAISMWLCIRLASLRYRDNTLSLFLVIVVFLASQPLLENVGIGQINLFLLLGFLLCALSVQQDKNEIINGIILSLIVFVKPQFALFFLYFLYRKKTKLWTAMVSSYLFLRCVEAVFFGLKVERAYLRNLFYHISQVADRINLSNLSIREFFNRLLFNTRLQFFPEILYVLSSLSLLIITGYAFRRYKQKDEIVECCCLICLVLMISPLTEEHHMILLNIPMVMSFYVLKLSRFGIFTLIISIALIAVRYSLNSFEYFNHGFFSVFSFGKLLGASLLWFLYVRHILSASKLSLMKEQ